MTPAETLTARAALWAWAARALSYPTAEREQTLGAAAERDRLAAAALADPGGAVTAALQPIWAALDEPSSGEIGLAEEHTFLFGRHVRVPPYESSYVLEPGTDRSTHLAEIGGLYAAFGLTISTAHPDMPDHLGAECELLAVLLAKEAYALARGWPSRAKLTRRARRKLVLEHLGRWLPAFAERLEKHHRLPFYPALAALLLQLLSLEQRLLDTPRPSVVAGAGAGRP